VPNLATRRELARREHFADLTQGVREGLCGEGATPHRGATQELERMNNASPNYGNHDLAAVYELPHGLMTW